MNQPLDSEGRSVRTRIATFLNNPSLRGLFWVSLLILITGIVIIAITPWNVAGLTSHPHPADTYAQAFQRIEILRKQEGSAMNPVCQLQLLTHNRQVEDVIAFIHGYTNCPQQFNELGQRFYHLGYNVLIAPLPHHGLADRMTEEQAQLNAEELANYADEVVDITQGLGEQVTMVGISGGWVVTAWAAQYRKDLDLAVIISPAFGYQQIATPLTTVATNLYLLLPNSYRWRDDSLRVDQGPAHCYPLYSTHALAEILRLGFAVQVAARREPPAARSIIVVTNANDTAVNPVLTAAVVKNWRKHQAKLSTYDFEAKLRLGHDLIDPAQPNQKIDIVYPKLIDLITQ